MAKISEIVVDVKAQEEGEWLAHPNFDGVEVLVRSVHAEPVRKRRAALQNRLPAKRRKLGDAIISNEDIERQVTAACCIGWRGIEAENGVAIEWSEERSREWAKDPQYRRLFEGIRELAEEIGQAESEAREESVRD
jgi:hypothetical protein